MRVALYPARLCFRSKQLLIITNYIIEGVVPQLKSILTTTHLDYLFPFFVVGRYLSIPLTSLYLSILALHSAIFFSSCPAFSFLCHFCVVLSLYFFFHVTPTCHSHLTLHAFKLILCLNSRFVLFLNYIF